MTEATQKTDAKLVDLFSSARLCSVPLVAIRSVDQMATVSLLAALKFDEEEGVLPSVCWDAARGLVALTPETIKALARAKVQVNEKTGIIDETIAFSVAMEVAGALPRGTVVFALNAHRQFAASEPISTATAVQSVANLRDIFKKNHRMLVMLGPGFVPPVELSQDIVVMNHELPDAEALGLVVSRVYEGAFDGKKPSAEDVEKSTEALSGLSEFAAEQQFAISLSEKGINHEMLWERSRVTIEQTKGLKVHRGGQKFADIIGCDSVKAKLDAEANGREPVGVYVFMDEIDKALANVEQDSTGVRMDQLRTLLTEMEDNEWEGMILNGLPGAGKSLLAKAAGNEAGVITISLDLAGMEGSLVGESEAALRQAIAVIKAVGRNRAYFIATSNNASPMRPELQRRFTGGVFFFDLMSNEQRVAAWKYYVAKYGLDASQQLPADDGWTAAEIRNCCRTAWKSNGRFSIVEASRFIVPVATSQKEKILFMRAYAHERFLDANRPGLYSAEKAVEDDVLKKALRSVKFSGKAN